MTVYKGKMYSSETVAAMREYQIERGWLEDNISSLPDQAIVKGIDMSVRGGLDRFIKDGGY